MQWNRIESRLCLCTAAKGARDMSLKALFSLAFALHICFVPDGPGRAHASVTHSAGGGGFRNPRWAWSRAGPGCRLPSDSPNSPRVPIRSPHFLFPVHASGPAMGTLAPVFWAPDGTGSPDSVRPGIGFNRSVAAIARGPAGAGGKCPAPFVWDVGPPWAPGMCPPPPPTPSIF